MSGPEPASRAGDAPRRSELEVRLRQARNPPPPVLRAVIASLAVAISGGLVLLGFDWLAANGVVAGKDVVGFAVGGYVALVVVTASVLTYLWVELPTGATGIRRRSPWSALLGLFASVPIVYLALVVIFQVVRPLLPGA